MFWLILLIILSAIAFITFGAFKLCANIFLKSVCTINADKAIAITFDDGPHPDYTPKLLGLLRDHNVKASFFLIGKEVEAYPEIVKRIAEEGHTIGLHSYAHTYNYGFLSTKAVIRDLTDNAKEIKKASGEDVVLFRPPFGVTNPNIAKAVKNMSLTSVGWSLRTFDTNKSKNDVLKRLKRVKSGDIVLMHDHLENTCEIVEQFIGIAHKNGLKFVNLEDAL
jgi:peptidoglycan/xylan/chitin deacetylase (PgdA/CDA1 family)